MRCPEHTGCKSAASGSADRGIQLLADAANPKRVAFVLHRFQRLSFSAILLAALFGAGQARADEEKKDELPPSIVTALPLFADIATYRQQIYDQRGVQYQFAYIGDGQANLSGGVRRGA